MSATMAAQLAVRLGTCRSCGEGYAAMPVQVPGTLSLGCGCAIYQVTPAEALAALEHRERAARGTARHVFPDEVT